MKRNNNFVLKRVADQHFLLPTDGRQLSGRVRMTESGAMIWNLLSSEKTLEQLVSAITSEYDVSPETAEQDIRAFLLQMNRMQLLSVS